MMSSAGYDTVHILVFRMLYMVLYFLSCNSTYIFRDTPEVPSLPDSSHREDQAFCFR